MDDLLETPNAKHSVDERREEDGQHEEEDEQSSEDEDGGLDWSKLPQVLLQNIFWLIMLTTSEQF